MMKKSIQITTVALVLLAALGLMWLAWGAEPEWIQYNERVVGENSPLYDDVVNRPMKQIWGNFTSEHNVDGSHKPVDVLASPYTLSTLQFRDNSGTFEYSDDSGSSWNPVGGSSAQAPIVSSTDLIIDSSHCGRLILDNWGNVTLPASSTLPASCRIDIFFYASDSMITPDTGDTILIIGLSTAAGGWISNLDAYSSLVLIPDSTGWVALNAGNGDWYTTGGGE